MRTPLLNKIKFLFKNPNFKSSKKKKNIYLPKIMVIIFFFDFCFYLFELDSLFILEKHIRYSFLRTPFPKLSSALIQFFILKSKTFPVNFWKNTGKSSE